MCCVLVIILIDALINALILQMQSSKNKDMRQLVIKMCSDCALFSQVTLRRCPTQIHHWLELNQILSNILHIYSFLYQFQGRISETFNHFLLKEMNEKNIANLIQFIKRQCCDFFNLYNINTLLMRSILKLSKFGLVPLKSRFGLQSIAFSFSTSMADITPLKIEGFKLRKKHELPVQCIMQHYEVIKSSRSCNTLAALIKDNSDLWLDQHLRVFFIHMRDIRMDPTRSFYEVISPFSIEFLKNFNRQQAITMYEMLRTMIELKIEDKPLWNALVKKLDVEDCYKYIPLKETAILLQNIIAHPEHSASLNSLTRKLITVVYQQKSYYNYFKETREQVSHILNKIEQLKLNDLKLEQVNAVKKLN